MTKRTRKTLGNSSKSGTRKEQKKNFVQEKDHFLRMNSALEERRLKSDEA